MDFLYVFIRLIGKTGVLVFIFALFYYLSYRNSIHLFNWVEEQTYGTRDYIIKKLEFLHIKIEEVKITYLLLFLSFGLPVFVFCLGWLFLGLVFGILMGLLFFVIGWRGPRPIIDFLVAKRIKDYSMQMVDALNLLGNGIRAGLSLPQSLGMVVGELSAPISQEYNIILQQNRIGRPLEECFEDLNQRIPTPDNQMFVTSINILRETGGNLAETFSTITDVIRERIRVGQKIETEVSRGMMQGYTLFAMPFVMGGLFTASSPDLMGKVFEHPIGIIALFVAFILDVIGLIVIFKIVRIKV